MFLAAKYLSSGSELLLEILGPGIVGGLFLPALGALPDAMLILGNCLSRFMFYYYIELGFVRWAKCTAAIKWYAHMVCLELDRSGI